MRHHIFYNNNDQLEFDFGNIENEFEEVDKTEEIISDNNFENESLSNINREFCFKCGKPTVKKMLFSSYYYYCENCKK